MTEQKITRERLLRYYSSVPVWELHPTSCKSLQKQYDIFDSIMATLYRFRQNLSISSIYKEAILCMASSKAEIKFCCDKSIYDKFAIHCAALIAAIAPSATAVAA